MSKATDQAFGKGYQAALRDVAEANELHGVNGAFEWILNNTDDPRVRALVEHLARPAD